MGSMPMVEIGEMLRQAREKKALTIDEARKQTRIHSNVLIALEEGRCDDILNPTYVKSFLKKYSSYLGLDSRDILNRYLALHPGSVAQAPAMNKPPAKDPAGAPVLERRPDAAAARVNLIKFILTGLSFFLIIALLFLGAFLWKKTIGSMVKPKFAGADRERRFSGGAKAVRRPGQKRPQTAVAASKEKKGIKIIDLKFKEVSRSESAKRESAARTPLPKNAPFDPSTKAQGRPELLLRDDRLRASPKQSRGTPFKLTIRVREPVLIQLKKDGVLLFKRVLSKGDMESYRVNEVVNIYVAKVEAIELILDGRILNVPARGIVRNLEVTKNGVAIK